MLLLLDSDFTKRDLKRVVKRVEKLGLKAHVIPGARSTAVGITGNDRPLDPALFEELPGVKQAIPVTKPYKLAGTDFKHGDTMVRVPTRAGRRRGSGEVGIGGKDFVVMAGPCSVESEEQTMRIARAVKKAGARVLRGGAFKPRSSPYAFQGLGREGLRILAAARRETGLPVITEALDLRSLELVVECADIVQIGARNMQNFALLKEVGRIDKPVILKRGMSATIDEWLMSAEYLMAEGNRNVILCERGIRTFSGYTRNTLDLNAVAVVRKLSHLPVIVDPSHGTGLREKVIPLARAAAAVSAHGVMVEVHDKPEQALSDGPQALLPEQFATLMAQLRAMGKVLGYRV